MDKSENITVILFCGVTVAVEMDCNVHRLKNSASK